MKYLTLLIIVLSGCSVGPKYTPPCDDLPCTWSATPSEKIQQSSCEDSEWWHNFNDPVLNQLIDLASSQNLDLQIAAIRILQARTELTGKKAELYPRLDGSAACGYACLPKHIVKHCLKRTTNFYEVGFDAEWEIDLFGMKAHEIKAAQAQIEATQENLCGMWLTLSAEIAKNYITLRHDQLRLNLLQESAQLQIEWIARIQQLSARGFNSEIDFNNAQGELHALQAQIPPVQLTIDQTINRLSILLGYNPGDLVEFLTPYKALPELPCSQSIGLPSDLLRRRPDILKAERELAAATEKVGSAIAALFPRFSLRGFIGDIATHSGHLFNPSSATALAGPQLLVPIFNSRLLMQSVEYNKLETQVALLNYQKTVLEALEEAENSIAAYASEEKRNNELAEALQNYRNSAQFTEQLYGRGLNDFASVVLAQKSLLSAQAEFAQSQATLLLNSIALYKAIGGGWSCE